MSQIVRVFDNFLGDGLLEYVQHFVRRGVSYELHSNDIDPGQLTTMVSAQQSIADTCLFDFIVGKISRHGVLNERLQVIRSYVNAYPGGDFSKCGFHTDDGMITALFYPGPWNAEFQGGTEMEDGTVIDYVPNRLALFDANIKHRALPHTNPNGFRFTVAFKMNATWRGK